MEDNFPRPGISGCFKHIIFIEFVEQEAELRQQCKQWGAAVNTDEASLAGLLLTSCWVTQFLTGHVPGASTRDPIHDKVMRRRHDKQGRSGLQGFRKAALALTLKMISVFLMLAILDYSLISVTQVEGLP